MQGCGPCLQNGRTMQGCAITGMTLEAIGGIALRQPSDQGITGLLSEHAGGGNLQVFTVAAHHCLLRAVPEPEGQHPIHQHDLGRRSLKPLQGPQHGALGGNADAHLINLPS